MPIELNFTGVEAWGEVIPEGDYVFVISDAEIKEAKDKKSQYCAVTYEVLEPAEFNGRKAWDNISFHEKAMGSAKAWLQKVLGEEIDGPMTFEPMEVIGKRVGATVTHKEYEGNPQLNFRSYFEV